MQDNTYKHNKKTFRQKTVFAKYLNNWPDFADPASVGKKAAELFCSRTVDSCKHYKEAVAWYGALKAACALGDGGLIARLISKYDPFESTYSVLLESEGHVDNNVFGIVPLELFLVSGNKKYLEEGLSIAEHQFDFIDKQIRYAIDDMYMITSLQVMAFKCSGDLKYINTAAAMMSDYLTELQQDDGLFYHHRDFYHKWGRGNGWAAAGMTELLHVLPDSHSRYGKIMSGFLKMMVGLLKYRIKSGKDGGLWKQIIDSDDKRNWAETSGSAMFCYAFLSGVKRGWLDPSVYGQPARDAWIALCGRIDNNGKLKDISKWAYKPSSHPESGDRYDNDEENYYFERPKIKGDNHGQAPLMWTAAGLIGGDA